MKLTLICLRTTRHTDSRSILTAFSRERGRVALGVPAGSGREAARLRALTMPLAIVTCESPDRGGQEVLPMRQVSPLHAGVALHSNPLKQMMAMFVAEVTDIVLRQGGEDTALFDFVARATVCLDAASPEATANFHLCFLLRLAEVTGIEPDMATYAQGRLFDMRDGRWRPSAPLHGDSLTATESQGVAWLGRMTFSNMGRFRMSGAQRRRALDLALHYFTLHLAPMTRLRSLAVLRSLT